MVKGSTLCEQHDDGGKIRQYGYGYYYADALTETQRPTVESMTGFRCGTENKQASAALTSRLDGFTVVAYTTEPSIEGTADTFYGSYMKMTAQNRQANGQWSFSYRGQTYTFTINPFFANALQYGANSGRTAVQGVETQSLTILDEDGVEVQADTSYQMPGTSEKEAYEIRSADQLQYLNWNYNTGNAYTMIGNSNYSQQVDKYTYLGYAYEKQYENTTYSWTQTHDVDAEMMHTEEGEQSQPKFTQIGSMYDIYGVDNKEEANAYMTYFCGKYDGNTYYIKNIEVDSKIQW